MPLSTAPVLVLATALGLGAAVLLSTPARPPTPSPARPSATGTAPQGASGPAPPAAAEAAPGRPAAGGDAARAGFDWPLAPRPVVVARFAPGRFRWSPGHRGVDLLGRPGQPVRAAGPGRVQFSGPVAGRGVVVVAHVGGLRTTYEPVAGNVPVGTTVTTGTPVGTLQVAGSHCPPAACLHWGAVLDGAYLDPLRLLGVRARPPVLLPLTAGAG